VAGLREELKDIDERVGVGEVTGDRVRPEGLRRDGVQNAVTERQTMLVHVAELLLQAFEELHHPAEMLHVGLGGLAGNAADGGALADSAKEAHAGGPGDSFLDEGSNRHLVGSGIVVAQGGQVVAGWAERGRDAGHPIEGVGAALVVSLRDGFVDAQGVCSGHVSRQMLVDGRHEFVHQGPPELLRPCGAGSWRGRRLYAELEVVPLVIEPVSPHNGRHTKGGNRHVLG